LEVHVLDPFGDDGSSFVIAISFIDILDSALQNACQELNASRIN